MIYLRFFKYAFQTSVVVILTLIGVSLHAGVVAAGGGGSSGGGSSSDGFSTDKTAVSVAADVMTHMATDGTTYGAKTTYSSTGGWGYSVGKNDVDTGGGGGGWVSPPPPPPTDRAPIGDLVETLGHAYAGPNMSCDAIAGWSCDREAPNNPVTIRMFVDGTFYTSFRTSNSRPDLINPPWDPIYHGLICGPSTNPIWGFHYPTPVALKDGAAHTVKLWAMNQGPKGHALDVQLPNETWGHALTIPLKCAVPALPTDLAAAITNPGNQIDGVPFTISADVSNVGRKASVVPFTLKIQIDKKNSTTATGWGYKIPGADNTGDVSHQTIIPAGLEVDATTTHDFTDMKLQAGEYRVRTIADPDFVIEASTTHQRENNTTPWTYFMVAAGTTTATTTTPSSDPDLSFESLRVTDSCTISEMTAAHKCPITKVSVVLENTGGKDIPATVAIPYRIEYKLPTDTESAPWRPAVSSPYTYTLGLVKNGGKSAAIEKNILNLPFGTNRIRAVVNPDPGVSAIGETNFTDNAREIAQTYQLDVADISFGLENAVIRYGATAKLVWAVTTSYPLTCTVNGDFPTGTSITFLILPSEHSGTTSASSPLKNTQSFSASCRPTETGQEVPDDVIIRTATVEVVPLVQEI